MIMNSTLCNCMKSQLNKCMQGCVDFGRFGGLAVGLLVCRSVGRSVGMFDL